MILDIIKSYKGKCIVDQNESYSYKDLIEQVESYKLSFGSKISDFDNIVLYSDYNFYSIALLIYLSNLRVNIIPIVKTTKQEYEAKINESKPTLVITLQNNGECSVTRIEKNKRYIDRFKEVTASGDTGIVLFSSGTSGRPKMMIQNFTRLISSIKPPRKQKSLSFLIFLMFDHIGGLNTLLNCLISGLPIVLPKDRNPSTIIELIEANEVNVLPTSPTFLNLLLMDESFDSNKLKSLKLITYGTERMSDLLLKKLNTLLPNVRLLQTFGTSETGILKTVSKSSDSLYFKIVDPKMEFKLVEGELYLKSKTSVRGYLSDDNKSFKKDGWFATGDLVEEDEDGFMKIIGRKNKVINVGGLKVIPSEVENVINSVKGVFESTVFGQENNITGNIVCAKVYSDLKEPEELKKLKFRIKKECRDKLDKYKIPMKIFFEELKINERGKKQL